MKNFVQEGDTITLAAPYDVLSGAGAKVGTFFGIASFDALSGVDCEFAMEGVFDIKALSTDTFAQGAVVYWDDTNKRCTSTSSGNKLIGAATVAKASGETTVRCRLNAVTLP